MTSAMRRTLLGIPFLVVVESVLLLGYLTIGSSLASAQPNVKLHGHVHHRRSVKNSVYGGDQPVSGSHVYLFAVNQGYFGWPPVSLINGSGTTTDSTGNQYVLTDSNGNFNLPFDASLCPNAGSMVYLLALQGDPGIGTNNPAIALISALPLTCSTLNTASSVAVNELTTVAAAFSLPGFANFSANGFTTDAANEANLAQGFSAANDMVSGLTGSVYPITPSSALPVPVATINTMADIIATCINSNGTTAECNSLFKAAQEPNGPYPTNTLQAAFGIALNPIFNASAIFNLLPSAADQPFQPTLTSSPTNWTIAATTPTLTEFLVGPQISVNESSLVNINVSCNAACGSTILFINGVDYIGPVTLDSTGKAGIYFPAWIGPGNYTVQVYYPGNESYAASMSNPLPVQVVPAPGLNPTTTTLTVQPSQILAGQTGAVDVQVSCNTTCGYISWWQDGVWLGTSNLDPNGHIHASTTPNLSVGVHTLFVQYPGDANDDPSTSNPVTVTVSSGNPTTIYNYNVSYQPNGNVSAYNDSVNGAWSNISYDKLNRLSAATQNISGQPTQYLCWTYDAIANRDSQTVSATPCNVASPPAPSSSATYTSSNQVQGFSYDASGNLLSDGTNNYLYDAEGRLCAFGNSPISGGTVMVQYIYDAEGARVAKGTITSWSCDTRVNHFAPTTSYIVGPSNEQITELDANGNWVHTNAFAEGQLVATYTNADTTGQTVMPISHFHLADWLGTNRMQLTHDGQSEESCLNLPFGDGQSCPSTGAAEATEHHFTGKERDTESGLDYFGARYYASNMGRFMSPDWAEKPEAVPYGHLDNPQSLNLYGYVNNNPLGKPDLDGHGCPPDCGDPTAPTEVAPPKPSLLSRFMDWNVKAWNNPGFQAYLMFIPGIGAEVGAASEAESGLVSGAVRSESVWSMGAAPRGLAIEAELGGNLPSGFPTIDKFSNGVATSIKSLDLNASSYQNVGVLSSKLTAYIDSVAGFSGGTRGGVTVKPSDITGRQLELAVPGTGTAAQQKVLSTASQYASSKGVQFTVKQVQ